MEGEEGSRCAWGTSHELMRLGGIVRRGRLTKLEIDAKGGPLMNKSSALRV